MNTTNYPYLAGYLQSIIRGLATDDRFLKLDEDARVDYVQALLQEADDSAYKYANGER